MTAEDKHVRSSRNDIQLSDCIPHFKEKQASAGKKDIASAPVLWNYGGGNGQVDDHEISSPDGSFDRTGRVLFHAGESPKAEARLGRGIQRQRPPRSLRIFPLKYTIDNVRYYHWE